MKHLKVTLILLITTVAAATLFFACEKDDDRPPLSVQTIAVSNITDTTATSGGHIISDGGLTVNSRGVVWGISDNPTVDSNLGITTNGTGMGGFTANLTGLTVGKYYYIRAYATNNIGTIYGNEISFRTLKIGQTFQGGIVAYIEPSIYGEIHGLIAAPNDQSSGADWISAKIICGNLALGGYSDWYLPNEDELNKLYLNKTAIGGFTSKTYWSSSQSEIVLDYALSQFFYNGKVGHSEKSINYHVRAVRVF